MTRIHSSKSLRAVLIVGLACIGFWQFGKGVYIVLKAELAQVLLTHTWNQSQNGNQDARPWPWADTTTIAKLTVPRLGIEQIVLSGSSNRNLAFAPAHSLASASLGEGSSVISAHRDTHFKFLQKLEPNDLIIVEKPEGQKLKFRVDFTEIADSRNTSLNLTSDTMLYLVTCYPFNVIAPTGPLRYVVTAKPEGSFQDALAQR